MLETIGGVLFFNWDWNLEFGNGCWGVFGASVGVGRSPGGVGEAGMDFCMDFVWAGGENSLLVGKPPFLFAEGLARKWGRIWEFVFDSA